jgi:hypothetical protein
MRRTFLFFVSFVSYILPFFLTFASGSDVLLSLSFDPADVTAEKVGGYDRVNMRDAVFSAEPGTPMLPIRFVQIAIPADLEVERIKVISSEHQVLPGTYNVYPAQPFRPLSSLPTKQEEIDFVAPDPSVYDLSSEYPGKLGEATGSGFLGGQHIAGVALYPLQYVPAQGKLVLYTRIEFELLFKSASCSPVPVKRRSERGAEFYSGLVKSTVMNPEGVHLGPEGLLTPQDEVDYLIITADSLIPAFQQLADWKIQKGISTETKEMSWVLSNYPGYDHPEKIRNCIRDFYSNRGTKWVLLGGDTDIVPHRLVWVDTGEEADWIPCDLYYSDLEGNWDANENHVYGEYEDQIDMYPDVFVGRAPSGSASEAQTFVSKCLTYETNPPVDYQTRILYAAEELWPGTDAGELKDYIDSSFVPGYFVATKLYQTLGNLNAESFGDALNQGQNIINHDGHGQFDVLSIGPDAWYSSDMDSLINAPRWSLFYSIGCITAAIDMDCIAEHFVNNPHGGGFAYCGNTRYGWGMPGEPLRGPNIELDIEFFRTLFHNDQYEVGKTLGNSKIPFIPVAQEMDNPYRWAMFTLLLLGDPTLEIWTNTPVELSVSHAAVCFVDMSRFVVDVVQDSALVCLVKEGEILGTAYSSGGMAEVCFHSPPGDTGIMHLSVTKHNYIPYRETVSVVHAEEPYVIYHSHQIDDWQGNGNGAINPGETIFMPVTVKNIGLEAAQGVSARLREDDDLIVLTDSVENFGDISAGATGVSSDGYAFQVDPSCPDGHTVTFDLEATDGESTWVTSFFENVNEADFALTAKPETVVVELADSASLKLTVTSVGGFNSAVDLSCSNLPPQVSAFFYPYQLIPTDSSILRIHTEVDAPQGIYPVTLTVSGGETAHSREVTVAVLPAHNGPVWHVSSGACSLIGNGSEEFPFAKIRRGIDCASDGDTILVEAGRYVERINFGGKGVLLASHFILDGLESTIESTIIDADGLGSVVTFYSGEDSNSVIRGFTLTGGFAFLGGGVYCRTSSPTIAENFLIHNTSVEGGAGIYCYKSSPRIYRNLITGCSGREAVRLRRDYHDQVIGNSVCDNASWFGLSIEDASVACVKNNIIYNHTFYGIRLSAGTWDISYNDVYGQGSSNYVWIPDQTGINGNISVDPDFVNPSAGDYHLAFGSPCVNAGDPAESAPPGGGDRIDIGALEYLVEFVRGDVNGDGEINLEDVIYLLNYLFKGGSPPYQMEASDANSDGEVDMADAIFVINYLFRGGEPPAKSRAMLGRGSALPAQDEGSARL